MCASATHLSCLAVTLWQVRACVAPVDMTGDATMGLGHTATDTEGQETEPHEPPPLGPAATPTNAIQPDVDEAGRDHYDEKDTKEEDKGSTGTFVQRDKIDSGFVEEGAHKGQMIDPRPYADLLYDMAGSPRMAPQMLTFLAGPEPRPKRLKMLIKALLAFKEDDEKGFAMVMSRFEHGRSYRNIGEEFGVSKDTARHAVLACVEHITDRVDRQWAAELEHAAYEAGSLDDDEGMTYQDAARLGLVVAPTPTPKMLPLEDQPFTRLTPIESYWRIVKKRAAHAAYERGA